MNQEIFAGEPIEWFWSSTPVFGSSANAWSVGFEYGYVGFNGVGDYGRVRCVLGPCSGATTQAAATVIPPAVGDSQGVPALCWELSRKDSTAMNWDSANSYCTQKGEGWRLPDVYELYELYQQQTVLGSDLDTYWFWSSTPVSGSSSNAWNVGFGNGSVNNYGMSNNSRVRCVRGL